MKPTLQCVCVAWCVGLLGMSLNAAEPRPGDEAIEKYLTGETKLLSLDVLAEAESREAWEAKREELKRQSRNAHSLNRAPRPVTSVSSTSVRATRVCSQPERSRAYQSALAISLSVGGCAPPRRRSATRMPRERRLEHEHPAERPG